MPANFLLSTVSQLFLGTHHLPIADLRLNKDAETNRKAIDQTDELVRRIMKRSSYFFSGCTARPGPSLSRQPTSSTKLTHLTQPFLRHLPFFSRELCRCSD
jgi:hypothetical protein